MAVILVVDDEAEIRDLIARVLTREGHQVDGAVNGRAGLDAIRLQPYDLVLCNVRMPVMDGPTLYTRVRDQLPGQAGRFIFCTGDIVSPEVRSFLHSANQPVLAKPFSIVRLREVVRHFLANRSSPFHGLASPAEERFAGAGSS